MPRIRPFSLLFRLAAGAIALAIAMSVTVVPGADPPADNYEQSVEEWHRGRIDRLTAPDGYLALAGLFPLEEGTNSFGSSGNNRIVFPEPAPKRAGTIYRQNGKIQIAVMPNVPITHDGKPVDKMWVATDHDEGGPTEFEMGTMRFYVIERGGELYIRLLDPATPLRQNFNGVKRFPVDEKWRVVAHFEPYDPPKLLHIPNVLGYEITLECPGALVFEIAGETHRLEPTVEGDEFFIVFGDETSGMETYGGGRFIYTSMPDESGNVVVDFNRAYNPPCAFTPYSTCPLPHKENMLAIRVEAGEKAWGENTN